MISRNILFEFTKLFSISIDTSREWIFEHWSIDTLANNQYPMSMGDIVSFNFLRELFSAGTALWGERSEMGRLRRTDIGQYGDMRTVVFRTGEDRIERRKCLFVAAGIDNLPYDVSWFVARDIPSKWATNWDGMLPVCLHSANFRRQSVKKKGTRVPSKTNLVMRVSLFSCTTAKVRETWKTTISNRTKNPSPRSEKQGNDLIWHRVKKRYVRVGRERNEACQLSRAAGYPAFPRSFLSPCIRSRIRSLFFGPGHSSTSRSWLASRFISPVLTYPISTTSSCSHNSRDKDVGSTVMQLPTLQSAFLFTWTRCLSLCRRNSKSRRIGATFMNHLWDVPLCSISFLFRKKGLQRKFVKRKVHSNTYINADHLKLKARFKISFLFQETWHSRKRMCHSRFKSRRILSFSHGNGRVNKE